jgi:RNAse (barnase) inhibitor barstar
MTETDISKVLIEGEYATIMGVKYKRVEEPESFYDKLWKELGKKVGYGIDCDQLTDRVMNLIKDNIPELMENKYHSDVLQGYNTAIKEMKERF